MNDKIFDSIKYVGITSNSDKRRQAHARDPEKRQYEYRTVKSKLSYSQARISEQSIISSLGLHKYFSDKFNRINSVSKKNAYAYGAVDFIAGLAGFNVEAGKIENRIDNEILLIKELGIK